MNPALTLAAGGLVGVGLALVLAGWWPAPPDLHATLARLHPVASAPVLATSPDSGSGPVRWWHHRAAPRRVEVLGLSRFAADLHLLDQTPSRLAARKVGYASVGLAAPLLLSAVLLLAGTRPPVAIPTVVGLALGGVMFFVPDAEVRRRSRVDAQGGRGVP